MSAINRHSRFDAAILDEFLVRIVCRRDNGHIVFVTHGEYDRRVENEAGCDQCVEVAKAEGALMDREVQQ